MLKNSKLKIAGILLVMMTASLLTWAIQKKYFNAPKRAVKVLADSIPKDPVYNKALLAKFQALCKKYDTVQQNYTLEGVMNIENKADTAGRMSNVDFLCCREGNAFYYRLGQTETINANGLYLYIDNQAKTILISAQKTVLEKNGPKAFAQLGASLKGEYYQLLSQTNGASQTITLLNEQHVSCKQYSVTFDTLNLKMKRIYVRLSNAQEPLRKDNEQVIDVSVSRWDDTADIRKYVSKAGIVKRVGEEWKLAEKYADYNLIKN